jgi:hypothetical protein
MAALNKQEMVAIYEMIKKENRENTEGRNMKEVMVMIRQVLKEAGKETAARTYTKKGYPKKDNPSDSVASGSGYAAQDEQEKLQAKEDAERILETLAPPPDPNGGGKEEESEPEEEDEDDDEDEESEDSSDDGDSSDPDENEESEEEDPDDASSTSSWQTVLDTWDELDAYFLDLLIS